MMRLYKLILFLMVSLTQCEIVKFVVVVASYNNAQWYEQNLNSIFSQYYKYYRVVYIDDCSTDNTGELVARYLQKNNVRGKVTLIRNKKRLFKMANLYKAIHTFPAKEVVVELDGDDFLAHPWVLKILAEIYADGNIWFTYGQFIGLSSGKICDWNKPMPKEVIEGRTFRQYQHLPSHLRTFYAAIFQKIKKEDLMKGGKFFNMSSDVAIALPIIEMAAKHFKFVSEPLLIYNDLNDLNDHKIDQTNQFNINMLIRRRRKYKALERLF